MAGTDSKISVWTETTVEGQPYWHSTGIEDRLPGYTPPVSGNTLTITGSGFGQGPIIYHFDRFEGTDRELITTSRTPDYGAYAATPDGTPRIYYDSDTGRFWFAQRDPNNITSTSQGLCSALIDFGGLVSTFRIGIRTWVPTNRDFPGATEPQTFPAVSSWKCTWLSSINAEGDDVGGTDIPHRNVCFPTHIGSGNVNVSGNSNIPRWYRDFPAGWQTLYTEMSHTAPTLHTFYQRGPGTHQVSDQPMELLYVNDGGGSREVQSGDPFYSTTADESFNGRGYECIKIGGWFGNSSDYTNTLPLLSDAYVAFGTPENPERARACVIVSNASTIVGSTEAYLIPPDEDAETPGTFLWADTSISVTIADHEDFGESTHVHLILSDGTLLEDVSFTRSE